MTSHVDYDNDMTMMIHRRNEQNTKKSSYGDVMADDILIYEKTKEEHYFRLEAVFKKAREVNLQLNPSK